MVRYDKEQQERRITPVYIGVVGPEAEIGSCTDSIRHINIRPGDVGPRFIRATKGYEARQMHFHYWLHETNCGAMLLLDHDMIFPPDTLERLRSHGLPYVSGYYLRRMYRPIAPIWFEPFNGDWPMKPILKDPERGKLHELGASGWGVVLVHREVAEAVAPLLKGETFVIEDDMDVWPYHLPTMLGAIKTLQDEVNKDRLNKAELQDLVSVLSDEFKVLRGTHDPVGSDLRFPYFAKEAGYTLYGDPDVRCGHNLNYNLHPDDFTQVWEQQDSAISNNDERVGEGRKEYRKRIKDLGELRLER